MKPQEVRIIQALLGNAVSAEKVHAAATARAEAVIAAMTDDEVCQAGTEVVGALIEHLERLSKIEVKSPSGAVTRELIDNEGLKGVRTVFDVSGLNLALVRYEDVAFDGVGYHLKINNQGTETLPVYIGEWRPESLLYVHTDTSLSLFAQVSASAELEQYQRDQLAYYLDGAESVRALQQTLGFSHDQLITLVGR